MFRKLHFTVQSNFKKKTSSNALTIAAIGKPLQIANINNNSQTSEAAAYYLSQKIPLFFALFYKTRANTQQVLPVQTGSYRYDE